MIYVNSKYVLYQHSFTEVDTYFVFESNNKLQCKFISSRGGRHLHIDADGTGGLDVSPIQFCRRAKDTEGTGPPRAKDTERRMRKEDHVRAGQGYRYGESERSTEGWEAGVRCLQGRLDMGKKEVGFVHGN